MEEPAKEEGGSEFVCSTPTIEKQQASGEQRKETFLLFFLPKQARAGGLGGGKYFA